MNLINHETNTVNKEELKTFEVPMWWYELHGGKVKIQANSQEEAESIVESNFEKYKMEIKKSQDTHSNDGEYGIDEAIELQEEKETKNNIFEDKFNSCTYITTTTGHYRDGNILELGKVIYSDYSLTEDRYIFKDSNGDYNSRFDFYKLGACPSRKRENVIFEQFDFDRLLQKSLQNVDNKIVFAKNIEEALSGDKYIIMKEEHASCNSDIPKTIQFRAVKIEKGTVNVPYRIHIMDNSYIQVGSKEEMETFLIESTNIRGYNNSRYQLFINTSESLKQISNSVRKYMF